MTVKELEKYHNITVRLKAIRTTIISDSVVGSSSEYPYTAHSISLHGVQSDKKAHDEIKELESEKQAIDDFIDGIADMRAKTLLDLHYRRGKQWASAASITGYSKEANEKYLQRFFKCL